MEITNQQYKFIAELLWGCVPIDKAWAQETSIFKLNAEKILKQYPFLDKSFFTKTYKVIDTWNLNKVVFTGDQIAAESYIRGNNVYQMNYSKLKLKYEYK